MLLIALILATAPQPRKAPTLPSQVWEKQIAPGLMYRMEWDPGTPRVINALRISVHTDRIHAYSQLAGGTVFEPGPTKGRGTVSSMVAADGAIAGVNGDMFPWTGDPIGLMVRDGELLSAPYQVPRDPTVRRIALGWGDGYSSIGLSEMALEISTATGKTVLAQGLNEDGGPDRVTVDFPPVGLATAKGPNAFAVVETNDTHLTPTSEITGTIQAVGTNLTSRPVESGTVLLLATGKAVSQFVGMQAGDSVKLRVQVQGFDFKRVQNVMGGGPMLVRDGQTLVDNAEERIAVPFTMDRHPRSLFGRTKTGDLWLVTIDGRSAISAGASLPESAEIMRRLGCVDAINLDGGGSTTFDLFGATINRPSDGIERPVANAVLIKGRMPEPSKDIFSLSGLPGGIRPGAPNHIAVVKGNPSSRHRIANTEVVWTCSGSAWIDQGGNLHVRGAGEAHVTAYVRGVVAKGVYKVVGVSAAPEKANPGGKDD